MSIADPGVKSPSLRGGSVATPDTELQLQFGPQQIKQMQDAIKKSMQKKYLWTVVEQLLFGIIFYFVVVKKYPKLTTASQASQEVLAENPVGHCFSNCFTTNCLLATCCASARQALNMHATDTMSYWPALFLSVFCPCCTTWYADSFAGMNEKLGGESENCCTGCMCAWCCTTCVIYQRAHALDAATGFQTECCNVTQARMSEPYIRLDAPALEAM